MTPRTLRIVCAVSILLNIFLLAAAIGGAAWLRVRPPMLAAGALRFAGGDLPRDQRRAFRMTLRDARAEARATVLAGRQARADAALLLRAPVLDQAALGVALARVRAADFAIRGHIETRAIGFAASLPLAERAKLADALVRPRGASGRR